MPSSRRSARAGRASDRTGSRGRPADGERPSRDSGQGPRKGAQPAAGIWAGVAVCAVVLVILAWIVLPGGGRKPPPKPPEPPPVETVRPMRRDWYAVGFERGRDWKYRTRHRRMAFTREKILETADLMTSDYANKGITKEGEKAFVRGFGAAVFGE